jgi:hypothetical protein
MFFIQSTMRPVKDSQIKAPNSSLYTRAQILETFLIIIS